MPLSLSAQLEIKAACADLMMQYAVLVDRRDYAALQRVFHPDAVWTRPGVEPLRGWDQMLAYFLELREQRRARNPEIALARHLFTTILIEVASADLAHGTSYALVFRNDLHQGPLPSAGCKPHLLVQYQDEFRRHNEIWQIHRHTAVHVFSDPSATGNG